MADHWDRFWSGQSRAGRGCMPTMHNPVERVQRQLWHDFARELPKRAKVLDLATGDGCVMAWLLEWRRDLKSTGVDIAQRLPAPPKGARSRGGVSLDCLPFPDASFDAITSQFGIEYALPGSACAEAMRVLRRSGHFRLLIHHAGGPIVAHNARRAEGLRWATIESGAVEKARNFASARTIAALPTPAAFRDLVYDARARFGVSSGAEEFTAALLKTLELSRNAPSHEVTTAIEDLQQLAADELARIDALTAAAADEARIGQIVSLLTAAGAAVDPLQLVSDGQGTQPFAWLVEGARS